MCSSSGLFPCCLSLSVKESDVNRRVAVMMGKIRDRESIYPHLKLGNNVFILLIACLLHVTTHCSLALTRPHPDMTMFLCTLQIFIVYFCSIHQLFYQVSLCLSSRQGKETSSPEVFGRRHGDENGNAGYGQHRDTTCRSLLFKWFLILE